MQAFQQLDQYLQSQQHDDYWGDIGLDTASAWVRKFKPEDWQAVESAWRERPGLWVDLLIAVLPAARPRELAAPLFEDLLVNGDEDRLPMLVETLLRVDNATLQAALSAPAVQRLRAFAPTFSRRDWVEQILTRAGVA